VERQATELGSASQTFLVSYQLSNLRGSENGNRAEPFVVPIKVWYGFGDALSMSLFDVPLLLF